MVSALPVQDHVDDGTFLANDELIECCAQDPLACRGCRGRMRPGELEIGTELHQLLTRPCTPRSCPFPPGGYPPLPLSISLGSLKLPALLMGMPR